MAADLSSSAQSSSIPRNRRPRRWLRALLWTVSLAVLLAVFLVGAGLLWLRTVTRRALPPLNGDLHLAGLTAPVLVRRDAHGVPHISAQNQLDLFFAQGYVTAQDRLWQMDILRRNADGQLAQILGPSLVDHDRAQRLLRFARVARRVWANLPPQSKARFRAYASGVNLFIAQHAHSLPPEFRLLGYQPQPWTGPDSLSIGMVMIETVDTHWDVKLARARISADLHNPTLEADLYPVGSWRDHPPTGTQLDLSQPHAEPSDPNAGQDISQDISQTISPDISQISAERLSQASPPAPVPGPVSSTVSGPAPNIARLRAWMNLPTCRGCAPGSNEWVISGAHTTSGKPLLSNDMHLALTEPNIWYIADLEAPGFHAAGVTLPGMPFVIAGHNEHVAWGFTALYADVQDLYLETLDGHGHYRAPDGSWKRLRLDHEIIHVRGGPDVDFNVRSTDHGPLLNPILHGESQPIALRWTLYDPSLNTLPLYAMNSASNWSEFSAALTNWCWPTQNLVYSDDQGHIAYHAIGRVPIRPAGLADVPIPANGHEWEGYIPFDQMPSSFDPPSGFLATANSRVTTFKSSYPLTDEWVDPYRTERIYKKLQGRDQLTPRDMLALQTDIYSEIDQQLAQRFAYAIDQSSNPDDRLRAAADLMRTWDGRVSTGSAAASLVTRARKALWPLLLRPKLGKDADLYHWSESNYAEEEIIMDARPQWLPPGFRNWNALLTEAVREGMQAGHAPPDVSHWAYGDWHVIEIDHPLARYLPIIGRMADTGPLPLSGDTTTVKQVGRSFGPSQRFTMDWSNIDQSTEDIVLGESGNPLSPYFRDQWQDYYSGRTFALPFTSAAVAQQTRHTLRLLP
ncbi:MAG TPA: penicillin acylase family protein [Terracidiphilus sp.]|nr:penicillin acylase family protein [Terracidiphilus sp.]